jgi:uncharacterized RDD family membrane protein YckC
MGYSYPAGGAGGHQYAGFGARLGGYLLDSLLYGLALLPFGIAAGVLAALGLDGCTTDANDEIVCEPGAPDALLVSAAVAIGLVGIIIVAVLYFRALGRTGQTWGRKIVGVRVVGHETGQPLGVGKAILRQLLEGLFLNACILGHLWMLWDKKNQTWHDKVISSVVVRA